MAAVIVYVALGSGEVQTWALDEEQLTEETDVLTQNIQDAQEADSLILCIGFDNNTSQLS